jgi:hydroxymethylpyrimidine pyrophosphatase-like HAD family hydrolase
LKDGPTIVVLRHGWRLNDRGNRDGLSLDELVTAATAAGGTDAVVTHSGDEFVEVSGKGVTKAVALAHVARSLRISRRDVIAFGDMPNDIPMLEWTGHAIAVANADPSVLRIVDEVTTSNDADGVAHYLERRVV